MTVISLPRVRHGDDVSRDTVPSNGSVMTGTGHVRLKVYRDFQQVESLWTSLQTNGVCVQAQTYERSAAWFRHVTKNSNAEAVVVTGHTDNGELLFLWPFEVQTRHGIRYLTWIGSAHANYNMGLHTLEFACSVNGQDMKLLLNKAANLVGDVSAAYFDKQPREWDGVKNPFALLSCKPSANSGHAVLLDRDFDTLYRNRFGGKSRNTLKRKERRLKDMGPFEMSWAEQPEERNKLLDLFFNQKAVQFAEQGIEDAFSEEKHRNYYRALAALPHGNPGTLEAAYLKVGDQVAAISCGIFFKDKFTTLLTSIAEGQVRRYSPGSLLLQFQIDYACRQGLNFFDMGTGDARHKNEWCDIETPLFKNIISFDERGYLLTVPTAAISEAKRLIKTHPRLWSYAQSIRRALYGKRRPKESHA